MKNRRIRLSDIDSEKLKHLVQDQKLSTVAIGEQMGCSKDFIVKACDHYNIERPHLSEIMKAQFDNGRSVNCKIDDIPSKDDLEYLYLEKKLSMNMIKDIMDTSIPTLRKWLDDYGIVRRTIAESVKNAFDTGVLVSSFSDYEFQQTINASRQEYNRSTNEKNLYDIITECIGEPPLHSYSANGINIDIFIPKLNIGIEYNGLFWHSEARFYEMGGVSVDYMKKYHKHKTDLARKSGIRLIHIFEDDWNLRRDIVILKIKSIIGCDDGCRVFARKCTIETVENAATRDFYDRTHIQGHVNASVSYGLFYGGMMVACMSFIKDGNSYVLVRYATSCSVVGGFSKLLKHFSRNHEYDSLISFADLSMVDRDNNVYAKTGWEVDGILEPDYKYIEGKVRKHKFLFRHKQLKTKLKNYDPNKSEYQNCLDHKLYRIWDCGKIRYRLDKA